MQERRLGDWMRVLITSALVTCWGAAALAQGLPVGFTWSVSDDELTITLDADDIIEDLDRGLAAAKA